MKRKTIEEVIEKHSNKILLIILIFGFLIRVIFLEEFPSGIHVDEAGIMYDSYCFANYGVDRYLYRNPVYLINFGGGQSILYTIVATIFVKLFGYRLFWVRFVQVLFAMAYIIAAYWIVKKWKNKKTAILLASLITIVPWHIMQSRYALDCNLMAPFILFGLAILLNAKKKWQCMIAGILFGMTLYTYILSFLVLPIFLIGISIYLLVTKKARVLDIVCVAIPVIVCAIPLLLFLLYNNGSIEITHPFLFSYPKLVGFRTDEISFQHIGNNIVEIIKSFFAIDVIRNLLYHTETGSIFSNFYLISRIFCLIGIGISIKNIVAQRKERKFNLDAVFLILLLSGSSLLLIKELRIYRVNAIIIAILYFTIIGIETVIKEDQKIKLPLFILYIALFIGFQCYYFKGYKPEPPEYNRSIANVINYADEHYKNDSIYISCISYEPYIYQMISNPISPYELQNDHEKKYKTIARYGKYSFNMGYENIGENTVCIIKTPEYDEKEMIVQIKEELISKNFKMENYTVNGDTYEIYYREEK